MIVSGADTHKHTHTAAAVEAGTGQVLSGLTAPARKPGLAELVAWGRRLDSDRMWAIEDYRHVLGSFGRAEQGARVRVARELCARSVNAPDP